MKIKKLAALAAPCIMLLMAAGDPQGFAVWPAGDLKARATALASKLSPEGVASDKIADYGFYNMQLAHRESTGGAELHEKFIDIFMIQSGDATLLIGGTIDGRHETGPGEIRGTAVKGGERHHVAAGDVVHIPANVPHQMVLDKGHQVTYFVVKVESR